MPKPFTISIFLIPFTVAAMPVSAEVERCISIQSSADRLACYDAEMGFTPATVEVEQVTEDVDTGDWRVRTVTSRIDDSTNVFVTLQSQENTSCPYRTGVHTITMACRENSTNMWINFGDCFMTSIQGKGRVTYRLDSDDARTQNFRESNNNMSLGLWNGGDAIPFIKRMLDRETMFIRATPFSDSAVTAEYNISGLAAAIEPLRESCNW